VGFAVERFDHIVLNCRDVEATAGWYERVLGVTRQRFGESRPKLSWFFGCLWCVSWIDECRHAVMCSH
jgi:catechol 2,3-dioxygenase-like lactoylglutathione lyase family enzyme